MSSGDIRGEHSCQELCGPFSVFAVSSSLLGGAGKNLLIKKVLYSIVYAN